MGVTVIVGGQYGSEGKGKVAYAWAKKLHPAAAIRVGGPNSGHTVVMENGVRHIHRMLPVAALEPGTVSILPAGSYLDLGVLFSEIRELALGPDRVSIDPHAVIIKNDYHRAEHLCGLTENIGSTGSGTGFAVLKRVRRRMEEPVLFAKDVPALAPYLGDTKSLVHDYLSMGKCLILEGMQGYGLSNIHTRHWPYATSRDTTAAGFLSEAGISPFWVDNVILVIRAFPIRVAGNSGPLEQEIDWETVTAESGSKVPISEQTTVTKKTRRVGRFYPPLVREAVTVNAPNIVVCNFMDYFDMENHGRDTLSDIQKARLSEMEDAIGSYIHYCGNGPASLIPAR